MKENLTRVIGMQPSTASGLGSIPMRNFTTLISVAALARRLDSPNCVLLDCRFDLADAAAGRRQYRQGHIPAALHADLERDLSGAISARSGRHPLPERAAFAACLRRWGVLAERASKPRQVVVYDHGCGAIAARLWWMLRWAGHANAALLDGGYSAWRRAGMATSSEAAGKSAGETTRQTASARRQPSHGEAAFDDQQWLSAAGVARQLAQRRIRLVDARAAPRFSGEQEPLDAVGGHVPGAVNRPFQHNLNEHGLFLPPPALAARFAPLLEQAGGDPAAVVHMCGSGVTACHNLLAMESAALPGSRLYVGSWSEWSRDPKRAIASGVD